MDNQKEIDSLFEYVFNVVGPAETEEIRVCDHKEAWQPPHLCPFYYQVEDDETKCVCCEDCEEECYIGI